MPTSEGLPQKWRLRTKKLAISRVRFLTVNIGTMTGIGRAVADMLKRRRVEIACVQETKWKGNKARKIREGYKLYYSGASMSRNGVGIILHSEWQDKILEVKRKSYRVMSLKLVVGKRMLNIISAYMHHRRDAARKKMNISMRKRRACCDKYQERKTCG